jgi:peroxiredoxin
LPDILELNAPAPDFSLGADDGNTYRLHDFRGKSAVLLFFYPADFMPVCTAEVAAFRDEFSAYSDRGVTILGVSSDSIDRHKLFSRSCSVPFRLLSDPDLRVARRFGALGLLSVRRAYFYIDVDGYLRWQHAEPLPIFKLSNSRILDSIDEAERQASARRQSRQEMTVPVARLSSRRRASS